MLTTSVIPESFVWAAEAEDVQGFEDGEDNEDVIFESAEEFVAEDVEESGEVEIQNFSESQDGDDTEDAFLQRNVSSSIGKRSLRIHFCGRKYLHP